MKTIIDEFLLRIEAVNLYHILDDTRQLSVRRGGSMLLRQAIKDVDEKFSVLESISTGASVGLFGFLAGSLREAENIREKVVDYLNDDNQYQHFCFVIDVCPQKKDKQGEDTFVFAKEMVIGANRFRQFQQPTLTCPEMNEDKTRDPCAWDNIRPAKIESNKTAEEVRRQQGLSLVQASEFVNIRHKYGREQKKDFIKEETDSRCDYNYTWDLHKLAYNPDFGNLSNKMAVLYFDGNGFGKIQQRCESKKSLKEFDDYMQEKRRDFLKDLVETAYSDENFWVRDSQREKIIEKAIRLEILLWGGDEITLVVPAWKGMEVLQLFYDKSNNWKFTDDQGKQHKLTHAGGLVFCHNKTPISRIQKLAQEIAEHIKENHSRTENLYNYLVQESIDYPTQPYQEYIKKQYGQHNYKIWQPQKPFYGGDWQKKQKQFYSLTNEENLSRRQVYKLAMAATESVDSFDQQYKRFSELFDNYKQITEDVRLIFPCTEEEHRHLPWLHMSELWDYFAPRNKMEEGV